MIQFSLLKYFRLHFMTFLRSNEILFSIAVSHTQNVKFLPLCSSINTKKQMVNLKRILIIHWPKAE